MSRRLRVLPTPVLVGLLVSACGYSQWVSSAPSAATPGTGAPDALPSAAEESFYLPPSPIGLGEPGDVIRLQELRVFTGVRLWSVLYRSTGLEGEATAVSAVIMAPEEASSGPHRYISWGHGTTGLTDVTAPSRGGSATIELAMFTRWAMDGFVVVATDYEGLGTPGPHPYIVGESEARSMLDALRAAREFIGAHDDDRIILAGHSQGGHAALFAGELLGSYAPELPVVGTVALAPGGDLVELSAASTSDTAVADAQFNALRLIAAWHGLYGLPTDEILTPAGLEMTERLLDEEGGTHLLDGGLLFLADPATLPAWRERLEENTPGAPEDPELVPPVLILQGAMDTQITVASSQSVTDRYCRLGIPVDLRVSDGDDHFRIVTDHLDEIADWITQRLAETPPDATCS
jgi:pimeloyl-ACP methyl ester carboxylesterase